MRFADSLRASVRGLMRDGADVVLGRACVACGRLGTVLCARCGCDLGQEPQCRALPAPTWSAAEYGGVVKAVVLAHKERGVRALTPTLGALLAHAVLASDAGAVSATVVLVPVPAHGTSLRRRGRDTVAEIAHAAAGQLRAAGVRCSVQPLLARAIETQRNAGRSARQRRAQHGAFVGRSGTSAPRGARIVVVDDVVTTGATVGEAARALTAAGIPVTAVATVASTPLHH